jgi:hypothetical protein
MITDLFEGDLRFIGHYRLLGRIGAGGMGVVYLASSSALATTNGYIDQANANVTTAFGYAADAFQAGSCGSPYTPPRARNLPRGGGA